MYIISLTRRLEIRCYCRVILCEHPRVHQIHKPLLMISNVYLRLENSRDDMRVRGEILEREVTDLQLRNEELTSLAQEAQALKDEMDILRYSHKTHWNFKAELTVETKMG